MDFGDAPPGAGFSHTLDLLGDGSIRLVSTPGHSPGHLSVLLRAATGPVLVVGDAAYTCRAIIGVSCLAQDIGERKRAERELERLADAAEHASDAVVSIDLEGRVRNWNHGAERVCGYGAEEAIGRDVRELTMLTDEPSANISRVLAGESGYRYEPGGGARTVRSSTR